MTAELAPPRIAVAYDDAAQSPMELLEAIGGGCEVVWVIDTTDHDRNSWNRLLPRLGSVVDTGPRSLREVADDLRLKEVAGVIAFSDSQLGVASELAGSLGLPSNPPSVTERLCDKWIQRQRLADQGVDTPRVVYLPSGSGRQEFRREIAPMALPFVIKPCRGSSSTNTFRSDDAGMFEEILDSLFDAGGVLASDYIAEEWLGELGANGHQPFADYVSVEAIAHEGIVFPLAITGKFPLAPPCRETGNFMPHHLDTASAEAVIELALSAAEALEVQTGALHIEIKLTRGGPRVIEVNGRVGGGGIASIYSISTGGSLIKLAVAACLGDTALPERMIASQAAPPFAYSYFVQPPQTAETLSSIEGLDRVNSLAGVIGVSVGRNVGDHLDWREGSQGYVLSVLGGSKDLSELATVPEQIDAALRVTYS